MQTANKPEPLTPYQRKLLWFLSVACFFEGYDFFALSQILPNLSDDFALDKRAEGLMLALINLGTLLAYAVIRQADRFGRKPVLTVTIAGYTLATVLSGLAPEVWSFTALQLLARVFLIAEWAVAMVYAAEEFPVDRRGWVVGFIQGMTSVGGVVCAGVVPLLLKTPWGWRTVYLSALLPLLLVAFARRSLRESSVFEQKRTQNEPSQARPLSWVLRGPERAKVLKLALFWALLYLGTSTAVTYWKTFALRERGLSDAQVGVSVTLAALVSMPLVLVVGKLLDRFGRRRGGALILLGAGIGIACAFTLSSLWALRAALTLAITGATAVLTVANTLTTEQLSSDARADGFAWANNLLGRIGYVIAPYAVALCAEQVGYGVSVAAATALLLPAVVLCWRLPETAGRALR